MRGATSFKCVDCGKSFISIHAPCEGSDDFNKDLFVKIMISIHAPCEGSDFKKIAEKLGLEISIHAPCEGSDKLLYNVRNRYCNFNPRSL